MTPTRIAERYLSSSRYSNARDKAIPPQLGVHELFEHTPDPPLAGLPPASFPRPHGRGVKPQAEGERLLGEPGGVPRRPDAFGKGPGGIRVEPQEADDPRPVGVLDRGPPPLPVPEGRESDSQFPRRLTLGELQLLALFSDMLAKRHEGCRG
jgi:hypothetical protein